jgi:hypothetical protein
MKIVVLLTLSFETLHAKVMSITASHYRIESISTFKT